MDILSFWFPSPGFHKFWFNKDRNIDEYIKTNFIDYVIKANNKDLDDWKYNKDLCLALIIIVDQLFDHCYRNDPEKKKNIEYGVELTNFYIDNYDIINLNPTKLAFVLLPLRHSKIKSNIQKALNIMDNNLSPDDIEIKKKFINNTLKDIRNLV